MDQGRTESCVLTGRNAPVQYSQTNWKGLGSKIVGDEVTSRSGCDFPGVSTPYVVAYSSRLGVGLLEDLQNLAEGIAELGVIADVHGEAVVAIGR